jgi:hypothetical protein
LGAALAFALPHASSSLALPIASAAFILADVAASAVAAARSVQPLPVGRLGHEQKLSLIAESHKRKSPVDKKYNGDKNSAH